MFPAPQIRAPSAQGRSANFTGRTLETRVSMLLDECGYTKLGQPLQDFAQPYYVTQSRQFRSIYGGTLRIDFYVWHPHKYPGGLVIECKSQERAGSVDEKYPYTIENLRSTRCATILVVEGNGPKIGALDWCRRQAAGSEWFRFYHGYQSFRQAVMKEGLL
jgi:hypothetical protein